MFMTETAAAAAPEGAAALETRSDAGAGSPPAPGGTIERPDYIPAKFWDGEAKAPKIEELGKSYSDLERLIGTRVSDLGIEARRKLAEALPDSIKGTWADEFKASLVQDEEFLKPLREQWEAGLPKPPEQYQAPETIDTEHPAFGKAAEWAKARGLPQDAFEEMLGMAAELMAPYEGEVTYEAIKEKIPDVEARAPLVANRVRTLLGPQADALLRSCTTADAFLALEKLTRGEQPIPQPGGGIAAEPALTEEKLKHMVKDERYLKRDPEFVRQVTEGFKKLYSDRISF
jgi:hypothetical protein